MHHMNWDDLKIFLAVAEEPSMRAAAKTLRVSHSTVSRRIETLEKQLAARLFDRMPDGYQLTPAGRDLLPISQELRRQVDTYGLKVLGRDTELEGQICVTMPDSVAVAVLMPYFAEFQEIYPDITLKIDDSQEIYDLNRREADIALRFTNEPADHLIGRRIAKAHQAAYAHTEYAAKFDFSEAHCNARWIGWGSPEEQPTWISASPYPHLKMAGHFNNPLIQREAVRQQMGIGYLPCAIMDGDPDFVRLSKPKPAMDFWVLTHRDLRSTERLKVFREFIFSKAGELDARLRGETLSK